MNRRTYYTELLKKLRTADAEFQEATEPLDVDAAIFKLCAAEKAISAFLQKERGASHCIMSGSHGLNGG